MQRLFHRIPLVALALGLGVALVEATPASAAITNRYSFTTDATDSAGGANGTLIGTNGSFAGGQLVLANAGEGSENPGTTGAYLNLPNGIVSSAAAGGTNGIVTVEMWVTMTANRDWAAAFTAGTSVGGEDVARCCNDDFPYLQIIPRTGDGGQGNDVRVTTNSNGGGEGFVDDLGAGNGTDLQIGRKEHIVAVFDQSANPNPTAGPWGTVTVYRNGSLMGSAAMANNFNVNNFHRTDAALPSDPGPGDVNIWLGRSQWGDALAAAKYDELRIYDTAVTANQALVNAVFGPDVTNATAIPSIEVNKSTGVITLKNNSAAALSLEYLNITSAAGGLTTAGFTGAGAGWDTAGGSNANNLTQLALASAGSTLAPSASISLGTGYNAGTFGGADGDLVFKFGVNNGSLFTGTVSYVGTAGTPGDFNNDTKVNGADFLVWQRGYPGNQPAQLLSTWKTNYGVGASVAAVGSVPEPAACGLAAISLLGLVAAARRKLS